MGIEPTSSAWKAEVLPLNYTRKTTRKTIHNDKTGNNNHGNVMRRIDLTSGAVTDLLRRRSDH